MFSLSVSNIDITQGEEIINHLCNLCAFVKCLNYKEAL